MKNKIEEAARDPFGLWLSNKIKNTSRESEGRELLSYADELRAAYIEGEKKAHLLNTCEVINLSKKIEILKAQNEIMREALEKIYQKANWDKDIETYAIEALQVIKGE